ncbi:hypothetical protein [Bradyrhizobium sp. LMG 9283]|uniref:hypothetical protein n=1 Tax=Bradyrhizobium sp. LMG 9283 TaxID=592064 RepID=UPI00388F6028
MGYVIRNAIAHTKNEASAKAGEAIANEAKAVAVEAERLAAAPSASFLSFAKRSRRNTRPFI